MNGALRKKSCLSPIPAGEFFKKTLLKITDSHIIFYKILVGKILSRSKSGRIYPFRHPGVYENSGSAYLMTAQPQDIPTSNLQPTTYNIQPLPPKKNFVTLQHNSMVYNHAFIINTLISFL